MAPDVVTSLEKLRRESYVLVSHASVLSHMRYCNISFMVEAAYVYPE